MPNQEHVNLLKAAAESGDILSWNKWRHENPDITPDLSNADLYEIKLEGANLSRANLNGAALQYSRLISAYLDRASAVNTNFGRAELRGASLKDANLKEALLGGANLSLGILSGADLTGASISLTNFNSAYLDHTIFDGCRASSTLFCNVDLSQAIGLDKVSHPGPSTIGTDTILKSDGKIPEAFLRGCGLDESFINKISSLFEAARSSEPPTFFISYSSKDEEFTRLLYSRLQKAKVSVFFAPEDIKAGMKLYDQIERAIQLHDRLLLVLSENSLKSNWVETEIRKAIETEQRETRQILFPIRLTDYDTLKNWRCFDAVTGKDLAIEVREYFIPDFSNWKDPDSFEAAFEKLLRDLQEQDFK